MTKSHGFYWSILVGLWRERTLINQCRVEDMKLVTPEIVWHSKEPVFSADFHRKGPSWRLATGGADNDIKVRGILHSIRFCS